jgi:hypothetical protein
LLHPVSDIVPLTPGVPSFSNSLFHLFPLNTKYGGIHVPDALPLDGHSTHISVGLLEWAKSMNIVIFILPAHTSHLLQPLDVACFGPVQQFMP